MQWIALEEFFRPICALEAVKGKQYLCPECGLPLRLKSGVHRKAHFYHIRTPSFCSQHKKTQEHINLQLMLAEKIPRGQGSIERAFPTICRIADVAWEERKIVYEIQCSMLSEQEAQKRCVDYRSLGWEIVWILSDKKFNRYRLSAAEAYLRNQTCYFARFGKNQIYDQNEVINGYRRVYKGVPLFVNPIEILAHPSQSSPPLALPLCLQKRWQSWKLRVVGDILSCAVAGNVERFFVIKTIEERKCRSYRSIRFLPVHKLLKACYLRVLKAILENLLRN